MTRDLRATARTINTSLRQTSWSHIVTSTDDAWYGPFLTRLALLTAGEELVIATGRFDQEDGGSYAGTVQILTTTRAIVGTVAGVGSEDPTETAAYAFARSTIVDVSVDATVSPFVDPGFHDWPGAVRVTARYAGGHTLAFPCDPDNRIERANAFELLPDLLGDLAG
ncbi:hypothetical protein [Actinotalea solisilvae]|uniref:hypothetical protein n=1 Tax=Actinotalea solisilvae TaxID=2072922 RepID=UPI0018F24D02|nr:hypothetical protein [Actinotalea solisilvae]